MRYLPKISSQFLLSALCLLITISVYPFLSNIQQPLNDLLQRSLQKPEQATLVKIVYFDDSTIEALGGWPISRNYYGYLIHLLNQLDVSVIGFDIYFPTRLQTPDEDDHLLVEMNRKYKNVVNSCYFMLSPADTLRAPKITTPDFPGEPPNEMSAVRRHLPLAELMSVNSNVGLSNLVPDEKGVIRSVQLQTKIHQKSFPAFGLKIAQTYCQTTTPNKRPGFHQLALKREPQSIYFQTPVEALELISARELMQAFEAGDSSAVNLRQFRNAIVIVSVLSESMGSFKTTPTSANYPAAGIHAQIIQNLLAENFLRPFPKGFALLILGLLFFIQGGFWPVARKRLPLLFPGLLLLLGGVYWGLFRCQIIFPLYLFYFFLGGLFFITLWEQRRQQRNRLAREMQQRSRLEKIFNQKIAGLSTAQTQLQQAHQSETTALQEKIEMFRKEIRQLQSKLRDQETVPLPPELPQALRADFPEIICAESSPFTQVLQDVKKVAPSLSTVLLLGENGTGKELVARALHRLGHAPGKPFIAVNCAALSSTLIESELFGHEKGAFTGATRTRQGYFETAQNGTIFLDEIAETELSFQAKLLRVVQEKEFYRVGGQHPLRANVRIIAATNRNIQAAVANREFREDLYYRLSVITLEIPPLRERPADIPLLVQHFLQASEKQFSRNAIEYLKQYSWPGNIRELQNLVQRSVIIAEMPVISLDWLKTHGLAAPVKSDSLGDRILEKFRAKNFMFRAISEIGEELGHLHRSTVTEHLKGLIFKAFYENQFSIDATIRFFNPAPNPALDRRLGKRIHTYLRNLKSSISTDLTFSENLARRKSQFKNLPQAYHFYLEEIIKAYLDRQWE